MNGYWCRDCKDWVPVKLEPGEYVTQARRRISIGHARECAADLFNQHPDLIEMNRELEEWYP